LHQFRPGIPSPPRRDTIHKNYPRACGGNRKRHMAPLRTSYTNHDDNLARCTVSSLADCHVVASGIWGSRRVILCTISSIRPRSEMVTEDRLVLIVEFLVANGRHLTMNQIATGHYLPVLSGKSSESFRAPDAKMRGINWITL
jgi:hypothetical protein